jgi:3-oxoacyl-[acyl-carrier-protein] synthase-1
MNEYQLLDLGIVCTLGLDPNSVRRGLFSSSGNPLSKSADYLDTEECFVGRVLEELPPIPAFLRQLDSRFARILFCLYRQIEKPVEELKRRYGAQRIGIVLGSSTSGIDNSEQPFVVKNDRGHFPQSYTFFNQEVGAGSSLLAGIAGISGPAYTISTACSSGAKAFASARNLLRHGVCDAVIVGGADALCKMTLRGFQSLDLISPQRANPMSRNRLGLNIGEGGALFVMVRSSAGVQLRGVGESSDAYHLSSPDPTGDGAVSAMTAALAEAGCGPSQVRYLNLHGTGTQLNDAMESVAVERVLGTTVPCSSTKPMTGHLLGASGACEAAFCWLVLNETGSTKPLPPHIWDGERDPALPEIALAEAEQRVHMSAGDLLLSNSFAFGGSNCCLAFSTGAAQ